MSVNLSDAARLVKVAQLQGIRLVEAHAQSTILAGAVIGEVSADINFGGSALPQVSADSLCAHAAVNVAVTPVGSNGPVVTIAATFELQYTIPVEPSPSQEELAAFAGTNAVFHAWPYWREFIQSTFLRMNLPPVLLPVFRLEHYDKQLKARASAEKVIQRDGQAK